MFGLAIKLLPLMRIIGSLVQATEGAVDGRKKGSSKKKIVMTALKGLLPVFRQLGILPKSTAGKIEPLLSEAIDDVHGQLTKTGTLKAPANAVDMLALTATIAMTASDIALIIKAARGDKEPDA